MAGTPEEDLLAWLEREEESLGFTAVDEALQDIEAARRLFYEELGYEMTEEQFVALGGALELRYEELPTIGVTTERVEQIWGYQRVYRDIVTGRFTSPQDVQTLLGELRGT